MIYDNENHVEEDINPPLSRIVILEKYRLRIYRSTRFFFLSIILSALKIVECQKSYRRIS